MRTHLLLAVPVLTGSLLAQVLPPGFDNKEGGLFAYGLGRYAQGRYQIVEPDVNATGAVVANLDYRIDYRAHDKSTALGRSWTRVRIQLAPADAGKMTPVFQANALSTPTTMFDAKLTWPTMTGQPKSAPAPWDTTLSIPLTSAYQHPAKQDLLVDFLFDGGTLADSSAWPKGGVPYYLDAANTNDSQDGTLIRIGTLNCTDSAMPKPATCYAAVRTYRKNASNQATADKILLQVASEFTAPTQPVLHAIGVGSTPTNVGTCNDLRVSPLLIIPNKANDGDNAYALTNLGYIPYDVRAVGFPVWTQAAWNDSKTWQFKLTGAGFVPVPPQPVAEPNRRVVYVNDLTSAAGTGPATDSWLTPIVRLRK